MANCVWANDFKIDTDLTGTTPALATIANLESLEMSIDGNVQDWFSMDGEGFSSSLLTAKKITFTGTAKVTDGDTGNDYIRGKMFAVCADANSNFQLTLADASVVTGNCVISVTGGLGAAEDVDVIEFEIHVSGKPTVT